MNDLDLDAIREHLARAEATGSWAFWRQVGDFVPALLAEVERLKAHQPDGGKWEIEYQHDADKGRGYWDHQRCLRDKCDAMRDVWYGPVKPKDAHE